MVLHNVVLFVVYLLMSILFQDPNLLMALSKPYTVTVLLVLARMLLQICVFICVSKSYFTCSLY